MSTSGVGSGAEAYTAELFSMKGKWVLLTGVRGIARALAIGFAKAGANLVLLQRNDDTGLRDEVVSLGAQCRIIECDLSVPSQVRTVIHTVTDQSGMNIPLDILINCAGIQRRHPATDFPDDEWNEVVQVNLTACFTLCRDVGKYFISNKRSGKIVNLGSLLSFQGGITVPAYAASKGGITQLTKALSNEWAGKNINVNAIAPGYIDTDMNTALINDETRSRQILERIPAGRWGKPEDFIGPALFLASKASDYVNGHILLVDGGWMGR